MWPIDRTAQYIHGRPKQRLRGSKSHDSRAPLGVHCSKHHSCWSKLSGHGSSRHHPSKLHGPSNARHHVDAARRRLSNADSRVPLGVHCSRHHPCWSKLSGHGSSRHHSSRIRGQSNSRHHGDAARRCLSNASRSHRCRSKSYPGSKHGNSSSPSRFSRLQ